MYDTVLIRYDPIMFEVCKLCTHGHNAVINQPHILQHPSSWIIQSCLKIYIKQSRRNWDLLPQAGQMLAQKGAQAAQVEDSHDLGSTAFQQQFLTELNLLGPKVECCI